MPKGSSLTRLFWSSAAFGFYLHINCVNASVWGSQSTGLGVAERTLGSPGKGAQVTGVGASRAMRRQPLGFTGSEPRFAFLLRLTAADAMVVVEGAGHLSDLQFGLEPGSQAQASGSKTFGSHLGLRVLASSLPVATVTGHQEQMPANQGPSTPLV